jgi:MarR family transcriptional regulator for hemolysin
MSSQQYSLCLDERHTLWQLLSQTAHAVKKARDRELGRYGVSGDVSAILFNAIRQGQKATATSIARALLLQPHTVSGQLTRMEKAGLVLRVKDSQRKNILRIEVTPKGWEQYQKTTRRRSTTRIMGELSPEERKVLWFLLAKLRTGAVRQLGVTTRHLYPPSDPTEFTTDSVGIV